jgi:hypothetical protein
MLERCRNAERPMTLMLETTKGDQHDPTRRTVWLQAGISGTMWPTKSSTERVNSLRRRLTARTSG